MVSSLENQQTPGVLPWWARDRGFGLFTIITGFIAWVAAGILVLERIELYKNPDYVTSCDVNPWISCGTVMKTEQAGIFGFPNPFFGIVCFAVVVTIGFTLLAGATKLQRWFWICFQLGVTAALGLVIWFWYQALYEINALCLYCMVVWTMVIPLFVFTTGRNVLNGVIPAGDGVKKLFREWSWIITAIPWLLVAATVILRFPNAFFG